MHAPSQIYQILHQHRLFGPWSEGVNFKKTYFESTHFLFWKGQCAIWVWKRIPADQRLIPLPVPGPAPLGPRGQFFTSDGEVFGSLPISLQIIPHYTQICCRILGRDQTYRAKIENITHLCLKNYHQLCLRIFSCLPISSHSTVSFSSEVQIMEDCSSHNCFIATNCFMLPKQKWSGMMFILWEFFVGAVLHSWLTKINI